MPNVSVYDMAGKVVGEMNLSDEVFGIDPNEFVLHNVVKAQLANARQGTQSTLTRAEVSGGGAKPYRQKGTGRARHGSITAPNYAGGGIAFGPKPRSYRLSLNKKEKRLAMRSALSAKVAAGSLVIVDKLEASEIKTKPMAAMLQALNAACKPIIVTCEPDENVYLSARNIANTKVTHVGQINVYDLLNAKKCVISKDAVAKLEEVYA